MASSRDKALAAAASAAASLMLVRGVVNELLPDEVCDAVSSGVARLRARMSSHHTIVVERKNDDGFVVYNHVYDAVKTYLASRMDAATQQRLCVSSTPEDDDKMTLTMADGEEMADVYEGAQFRWRLVYRNVYYSSSSSSGDGNGRGGRQLEPHSFEVTFHRKHKDMAIKSYLPFIVATAKAIAEQQRPLQICMNDKDSGDDWLPMDLHHPSTFQTLAMDRKLKQSIVDDLDRFVKREEYYRRIGKAWKRGYLLYGPPGTGKSSLIAAMANHLRFDVYDLELTAVQSNSDLRRLLVGVPSRSILVVEDIDCTIHIKQRELQGDSRDDDDTPTQDRSHKKSQDKVTLSGLLNFVDGLWSASGEQRIIVFTTNYKDRLDPALLRPGRMDMHVYMGHCTPEAFRILAHNYHLIEYHATYPEIEELIEAAMVTPAEVAEILMRNDDTDAALRDLVLLLKSKKLGDDDNKAANADGQQLDEEEQDDD
ncbi:hypothetical protein BS78_05G277500 [Paspalum vaginatum]|nr:hypothetical protein BS78_05G277500 [Paspalum vaginatum]